jgi:hypothetical protein
MNTAGRSVAGQCRFVRAASGAALCALAFLIPMDAATQVVTGAVTDESGAPVRGALIRLVDDAGEARAGVLTNEVGRYRLRAPGPGTYRLTAQRIGLTSVSTGSFALAAHGAHEESFELRSAPIALDGIVAWGTQRCDLRAGEGTALLALWEEARKAFEVVAHTRDESLFRLQVRRYERELDPDTDVVLTEQGRTRVGYWSGSPFVAVDSEWLVEEGFVQPERDGSVVFYLPDVDVLLSDVFHEAHCFRLVRGPDDGTVGIGIEPDSRREGVRGTLWLDRTSHEVRRLDYSLSHRSTRARGMPPAVGSMEFEGLPSGAWIVRRWNVRMPLMAERVTHWSGGARSQLVVHRIREEGGEVREIASVNGEAISRAETATLAGRIHDEEAGAPLAGAMVRLAGTDHSATTDEQGRFALPDLPTGAYTVTFDHPTLARYQVTPEPTTVALSAGRTEAIDLVLRRDFRLAQLRQRCASADPDAAARAPDAGIIVGVVRNARTGEPLRGATVRVLWTRYAFDAGVWEHRDGVEVRTDSGGAFLVCGVATDRPARIEVDGAARAADGREHIVRLDELPAPYTFVSIRSYPR